MSIRLIDEYEKKLGGSLTGLFHTSHLLMIKNYPAVQTFEMIRCVSTSSA
jgi:hypothetical protein